MKKAFYIIAAISLAALASCEKENNLRDDTTVSAIPGKTYTLAVNAAKSAGTKALDADLNVTWASGEKVAVYKAGSSTPVGTLEPLSTGSADAVLSGSVTIDGIAAGQKLDLMFVGRNNNDKEWTYEGQKGTLADIAANFDYARAQVTISSIDGSSITASDADFVNQQAIVKFTLKNSDGTSLLSADRFAVSATSGKLVAGYQANGAFSPTYGDLVIEPDAATSEIYVALRNNSDAADSYALTATVGTDTYTLTKTGVTFSNGTYKSIIVKMAREANTYTVVGNNTSLFGTAWDPTATANDMIKQTDGTYKKTYPLTGSEGTVLLKVATGHSWSNSYGGSYDGDGNFGVSVSSAGTLVVTFNGSSMNAYVETEDTYTVAGDESFFGSDWSATDTNNDMVKQFDGITCLKSYTASGSEGKVSFKVVKNHSWDNNWGGNGEGGNYEYTIPRGGTLMISFNSSTRDIDAWIDGYKYSLPGDFNSWNSSANFMTEQEDGTYTCTVENLAAGTYEYKVMLGENGANNYEWIGDPDNIGNNFSYTVSSPCDLIFTFNPSDNSVSVEESRVTLYFNIQRADVNNPGFLAVADLGTAAWPGTLNLGTEDLGGETATTFYKWQFPSSKIWGQTIHYRLVDEDYWEIGSSDERTFTPSEDGDAYYFTMASDKDKTITELSYEDVYYSFTSKFTGVYWSAVSWLTSDKPGYIAQWKATSDADNIYVYFKIPTSQMAADRYIYSGYDTDAGATGDNAGGNVNGKYNAMSLLYPFETKDGVVVCKDGTDSNGKVQCPVGTTAEGVKPEVHGEKRADYVRVEMKIPRTAIGSPSGTIAMNHSYNWYITGDRDITLYSAE